MACVQVTMEVRKKTTRWCIALCCFVVACPLTIHGQDRTGTLIPFERDGHWGYLNEAFDTVIAPRFEMAYPFGWRDELAVVMKRGKYGYVTRYGTMRHRARFDLAEPLDWGRGTPSAASAATT